MIVGPAADPAGIRGATDAVDALRKIVASNSKLLVHASLGADGVLRALLDEGGLVLPESTAILFAGDQPREVLRHAAEANAYTIVGRIPFANGKMPRHGLELMVRGDPRLRRPYLVVVAAGAADDPRLRAARALVAFLRDPQTQAWIGTYGVGRFDDAPIFFPMAGATRR